MPTLADTLELADALALRAGRRGMLPFFDHLVIDSVPPARFAKVADGWQQDRLKRLAPAIQQVCGFGPVNTPRWFWEELPRGHDKTSGMASVYCWALAFARRKVRCVHLAADRDQARLLREAVRALIDHNPWLNGVVKTNNYDVWGPMGHVEIVAADSASNYGFNVDIITIDEVTNWLHDKGKAVWDAVVSGASKRDLSVLWVITNAGTLRTWQAEVREVVRRDPLWSLTACPPYTTWASWMSPARVSSLRKLLTPGEAKRVYDNVWIDPAEDCGYLTRQEVEMCEVGGLVQHNRRVTGVQYFLSVDYGPKRDRTVVVVCHRERSTGLVVVDRMVVLQGRPGQPIRIDRLERIMDTLSRQFGQPDMIVDPYQLVGTIERFECHHRITRHEARGGKANYEMAECLRSLIVNGMVNWPRGTGRLIVDGKVETLTDELCNLIVKPMNYGYRFDHEQNKHDDRAVGLGMACLLAAPDYSPSFVQPEKVDKPKDFKLDRDKPKDRAVERDSVWSDRGLWGVR